jgi:hypothetical protein
VISKIKNLEKIKSPLFSYSYFIRVSIHEQRRHEK